MAKAGIKVNSVAARASELLRATRTSGSFFALNGQAESQQLIVVSCYTRFDNLAHGPRGTEAKRCLYTFRMDPEDGQMVLVSVADENVMNPAFSRFLPEKNILYTCTESVAENGMIDSWKVDPMSGRLDRIGSMDAAGTSTCYLTVDRERRNMLVVNYWNSTVCVFGLDQKTGSVGKLRSFYDPNEGREMKVKHDKHVNHSENDPNAQKERQSDPHSHAVIIDPFLGRIAFVPDLGMDVIRQLRYSPEAGTLEFAGVIRSGPEDRSALGPRYIEFHPTLPICYVVNELSSEVAVFAFDVDAAMRISKDGTENAPQTLRLIQTISTVPEGFPGDMNTCGRICVHHSGNFVLVSNRGHNSITVFRIHAELASQGLLSLVGHEHTRGATPRHFQFDASGQWLVAANQDSNCISIFKLNLATGRLTYTGHQYEVPSPNFVCNAYAHPHEGNAVDGAPAMLGATTVAPAVQSRL